MSKNKLGLPFEYQKHPEFFDAMCVTETTVAKNGVIEAFLKQHNVKTVLDLTCGTGSQVFFLAERGYQVTGADFSPALVEQARERAKKEKAQVTFLDGDMRTLQVGQFDAVITIFNAVGHVTKAGFEKTMRNIHRNLKPGGIYVFDILNIQALPDDASVSNLAYSVHKKVNGTNFFSCQCSTLDRVAGRLNAFDTYVIQKGVEKPQRFKGEFSLQIYTVQELKSMLTKTGFEVVSQCDFEGKPFVADKTLDMVTVAKKR